MAEIPLADYYSAIESSLRDGKVEVVPGLLVLMASDGYGHEAEELRRRMLDATNDEKARREALDLAITACHQRANRYGITPAEAALELMQAHPDNLAAYAAAHAYLSAQETKP